MSTNEPPRSSNKRSLAAIDASDVAALKFDLLDLRAWRNVPAKLSPARVVPFPVSAAQQATLDTLELHAADVKHVVATIPFWLNTEVMATRWDDAHGLADSTVSLRLKDAAGAAFVRTVSLPKRSRKEYDGAADRTDDTMKNDTTVADRVAANALKSTPQLLSGLQLSLHAAGQPDREYTGLVVDIVTAVASVTTHRLKRLTLVPRPYQPPFDKVVPTLAPIPGYSAYPAGHAVIGHALAVVLGELTGATAAQKLVLEAGAQKLAKDRERVGVHTDIELDAGATLGKAIGLAMLEAVDDLRTYGDWSAIFAKAANEWFIPSP